MMTPSTSLMLRPKADFELASTEATAPKNPAPVILPDTGATAAVRGGQVDTSPLVDIVVSWVQHIAPAPVQLKYKDELLPDNEHPFLRFINAPSPVYGARNVQSFLYRQLLTKGDGIARKVRDDEGRLIGLIPVRTDDVRLDTGRSGNYRREAPDRRSELTYRVKNEVYSAADMLHIRHGIGQSNMLRGESPFKNLLVHIFSDALATNMVDSLMQNTAMVQLLFGIDNESTVVNLKRSRQLLTQWVSKNFTGARAGGVHAVNTQVKAIELGKTPDELGVNLTHKRAEERVAGAVRIPPSVLQLGAGLETGTRNQIQTQRQLAFENGVAPLQWLVGDAVKEQLLVEFLPNPDELVDYEVVFDNSRHSFLQEELLVLAERRLTEAERLAVLVNAYIMSADEARTELGLEGPAPERPAATPPPAPGRREQARQERTQRRERQRDD